MTQYQVNIKEVREFRFKNPVYFGIGAIKKINDIAKDLKSKKINKVLVMTGRNAYKATGAWKHVEAALIENGIKFVSFNEVTPNPTVDHVDIAAKLGKKFGAKAVIAIGGGSAIDAGKSTAILLENKRKNARQLYGFEFTPTKAAPVVAINLTHGTGTEGNRFAVATIEESGWKPALAYDCIYPMVSIVDPALMTTLSENQTKYVSIDAVNHVIEAATTKMASPYSITLAKEVIRLVAEHLPTVIKNPKDLEARYYLAYAATIAGVSFDHGLLHYTHALEHPLSGMHPKLPHGLGLAMLVPSVVKEIYPAKSEVLKEILSPILTGKEKTGNQVAKALENWIFSVGVKSKLKDEGFTKDDIKQLVSLAFETPSLGLLLSMAPTKATKKTVEKIFTESMTKMR
ncbi:MAG: iron-containing alcohol dehydrogenase [Alphaproteobacteria bacterium]|jgi:alcohol dehydrogenase class IV|nr:iron-containing alcohol dehydrogenase [Alphaproteobacteria bacterium]